MTDREIVEAYQDFCFIEFLDILEYNEVISEDYYIEVSDEYYYYNEDDDYDEEFDDDDYISNAEMQRGIVLNFLDSIGITDEVFHRYAE